MSGDNFAGTSAGFGVGLEERGKRELFCGKGRGSRWNSNFQCWERETGRDPGELTPPGSRSASCAEWLLGRGGVCGSAEWIVCSEQRLDNQGVEGVGEVVSKCSSELDLYNFRTFFSPLHATSCRVR